MKKVLSICILVASITHIVFAEVEFSKPDLAKDNTLLFQATVDVPEYHQYKTLFSANVEKRELRQLTFFPEKISLLKDRKILQIQNRFGVFRSNESMDSIDPIRKFPSFVNGDGIGNGKISPLSSSPDGRFQVYLEPTSEAYAQLVLLDMESDKEQVISTKVEMNLDGPPISWSPDAKYIAYTKKKKLYYFSIGQFLESRILNEQYRCVGEGEISNIYWGHQGDLFYVHKSYVYRIRPSEFLTHSMYQELIDIGRIIGKIPFVFDSNFDNFWVSPGGDKILLCVDKRNIFLYYLRPNDYKSTGETISLPYLLLPRNTRIKKVIWSPLGDITLHTGSIAQGQTRNDMYRLRVPAKDDISAFNKTQDQEVHRIYISPEYYRAALLTKDKIIVRNYTTWKKENEFSHPSPIHAAWISTNKLLVAGKYSIEIIDVEKKEHTFVTFSQPDEYGFMKESGKIMVGIQDTLYMYDKEKDIWEKIPKTTEKREVSVSSDSYRVFLETLSSGQYKNIVMVRDLKNIGTRSLFPSPKLEYEPFPQKEEAVDFKNFTHGSRIRRREIALVFNCIDDVTGLTEVLNTLADYNIQGTFFVCGDFIQQHPGAVKEIAESNHEVGSLFYTYFDMTDSQYQIDEEFIKKGLARNEDTYFTTTGRELSLLWHAPYYFVSPKIIEASEKMNYVYVGRDVESLDWVPKLTEQGIHPLYYSSSELIERIMKQKKPGSIIPIRIGKTGPALGAGARDDYLFQRLDLLINGLLKKGYSIVTIAELIEHAK